MYSITFNKGIWNYKKNSVKMIVKPNIVSYVKKISKFNNNKQNQFTHNEHYISKNKICKIHNWIFIYHSIFVWNFENLKKKRSRNINSKFLLNQFKNNISKKTMSINQIHSVIENVNINLNFFKKILYGYGDSHVDFFSKKFENHNNYYYNNFKKNYKFINNAVIYYYPKQIAIKKKQLLNIYILDAIQSYKGVRHSKGLPCRGQRTWTNAWTSYRANTVLRVFKIKLLNRVYKKIPYGQINMYYLAEQINLLWKVFWKDEWLNSKKKVLTGSKKKSFNIDVSSMAQGNVISPTRLKKMSKKQKSSMGKNTLTLGFDVGFTKKVLIDLNKQDKLKKIKNLKIKKVKKNKIDEKTKIIKHKLKKKSKKSLWD